MKASVGSFTDTEIDARPLVQPDMAKAVYC